MVNIASGAGKPRMGATRQARREYVTMSSRHQQLNRLSSLPDITPTVPLHRSPWHTVLCWLLRDKKSGKV